MPKRLHELNSCQIFMSRRHKFDSPKKDRGSSSGELIMGRNCVTEVIRHSPRRLLRVYLAEESRDGERRNQDGRRGAIKSEVERLQVPIKEVSRRELDGMVGSDSHQGVVAEVSPRSVMSLEDLRVLAESQEDVRILALDGVLDPQNFGAILRAAECFGVDAVLWSKNRSAPIGPVVSKASVGASELVPLCPVSNLHQALETLKRAGVWLAGAVVAPEASPVGSFEFPRKCAIVMGSEGEGLQPLIEKSLDFSLFIEMHGAISSLNVSQATVLMLHAMASQRPKLGDVKVS